MNNLWKIWLLIGLTALAIASVWFFHPIPQPISYHRFADQRSLLGIPNFANVISNVPFLITGWLGLRLVNRSELHVRLRSIYLLLFLGVVLTGLGSAYYHLHPDNNSLVYDRIPMTMVFMSLFSATLAEMVNFKAGVRLFAPLVLLGIGSVLVWHWGEVKGHGDLRLYGLVQFYPAIFIPLILWLFYDPAMKSTIRFFLWIVAWYAVAKVLELTDWSIYQKVGISGHTFKHLAAVMSTFYFLPLFRGKYMRKER